MASPTIISALETSSAKGTNWQAEAERALVALEEQFGNLAVTSSPIILGPWLSEVGFELLYWIPFLRWAKKRFNLPSNRLIAVSRGGARAWYTGITRNYAEILDLFTIDEYVLLNRARIGENQGGQKQVTVSTLEHTIIERLRSRLGLETFALVHPAAMYSLFSFYWKERLPMRWVRSLSTYRNFEPGIAATPTLPLPKEYVAAKFYFSAPFPDTPENRSFIAHTLETLAERTHVILLTTGIRLDEHREAAAVRSDRIHTVDSFMTPSTNLEIQTRVIQGASAFVGTYGGFSYLAPLYGVDSLAFYSRPDQHERHHLDLAHFIFDSLGPATLTALDVRKVGLIVDLLAVPFAAGASSTTSVREVPEQPGQSHIVEPAAQEPPVSFSPKISWDARVQTKAEAAERLVERLSASTETILAGPWLGEVGFELLYWIPFLRWAVEQRGLPADRIVAISRGGVQEWYRGIAGRYAEIFKLVTPDHFRERNVQRTGLGGGLKQSKELSGFESELLNQVKKLISAKKAYYLAPGAMYGLLRPYYKGQAGLDFLDHVTQFRSLRDVSADGLSGLPPRYVAAKFYFSPNFPPTQENEAWARSALERLAEHAEVVLLDTGVRADDHTEFSTRGPRLHNIRELLAPETNLGVQTRVLSRAEAFVGTYGGLSYLASLCGTPALGFYSDRGPFNERHLALGEHVSRMRGNGEVRMMPAGDSTALSKVLQELLAKRA